MGEKVQGEPESGEQDRLWVLLGLFWGKGSSHCELIYRMTPKGKSRIQNSVIEPAVIYVKHISVCMCTDYPRR